MNPSTKVQTLKKKKLKVFKPIFVCYMAYCFKNFSHIMSIHMNINNVTQNKEL